MAGNPMMPGADTMAAPVGPWNAMLGQYLAPAPNTEYGAVLPVARDTQTGALRFALPSSLRDLGQGVIDLLDGPATGAVTPQATMALASLPVAGGVAAGADAAGDTLASGPIVAYHGSPHDFDAFDASKIGTGEGAQAYGHGLYFAGNENVARSYRDALSNVTADNSPDGIARLWVAQNGGDRGAAKAALQQAMANWGTSSDPSIVGMVGQMKQALPLIDTVTPNSGHMYQVAINADPESLLDWDKPLSEQPPVVQAKIANLANRGIGARNPDPQMTGGEWYVDTTGGGTKSRQIAAHLNAPLPGEVDPAVPGIQYLDAGSRAAGDGMRNYVVFDPAIIEMLRKYGIAGLTAGGGAGAVAATQPGQQPGT